MISSNVRGTYTFIMSHKPVDENSKLTVSDVSLALVERPRQKENRKKKRFNTNPATKSIITTKEPLTRAESNNQMSSIDRKRPRHEHRGNGYSEDECDSVDPIMQGPGCSVPRNASQILDMFSVSSDSMPASPGYDGWINSFESRDSAAPSEIREPRAVYPGLVTESQNKVGGVKAQLTVLEDSVFSDPTEGYTAFSGSTEADSISAGLDVGDSAFADVGDSVFGGLTAAESVVAVLTGTDSVFAGLESPCRFAEKEKVGAFQAESCTNGYDVPEELESYDVDSPRSRYHVDSPPRSRGFESSVSNSLHGQGVALAGEVGDLNTQPTPSEEEISLVKTNLSMMSVVATRRRLDTAVEVELLEKIPLDNALEIPFDNAPAANEEAGLEMETIDYPLKRRRLLICAVVVTAVVLLVSVSVGVTKSGDASTTDAARIVVGATLPISEIPSTGPSPMPTLTPSQSLAPSIRIVPSSSPSRTTSPSLMPTLSPSAHPTHLPTTRPSSGPSLRASHTPSQSLAPSIRIVPSNSPSRTTSPSLMPTLSLSTQPTHSPSAQPTHLPTTRPSSGPTLRASHAPSISPSSSPSTEQSGAPTQGPSTVPTISPSSESTISPSSKPTISPSSKPSNSPARVSEYATSLTVWAPAMSDDPLYRALEWSMSQDHLPSLQRLALATLYFGTSGEDWHDQLSFLTESDECTWSAQYESSLKGVLCDDNGEVTILSLCKYDYRQSPTFAYSHLTTRNYNL